MSADEFTKLSLTTIPFSPLRASPISCPSETCSSITRTGTRQRKLHRNPDD
jgi:hypothetical protein